MRARRRLGFRAAPRRVAGIDGVARAAAPDPETPMPHVNEPVRWLLAVVASAALLPACSSQRGGEPPAQTTQRESVKPGINDNFLDPDLDIDEYVQRFEVESRDIVAARIGILEATGLEPGMDVVDIGAGTGLFLEPFADAVGPEGTVYAIDIAEPFVEHLAERARDGGLTQVRAQLCSEDSIDLPTASVDKAFVCDVYHHFEYPDATLASIYDAVRPGGELIVIDFERIPGVTNAWLMQHVRAGKEVFTAEIEGAGFELVEEVEIEKLGGNYFLRFRRP
jgi:ubiquinone/menaquinone biosynthesis C-methylase UbiE